MPSVQSKPRTAKNHSKPFVLHTCVDFANIFLFHIIRGTLALTQWLFCFNLMKDYLNKSDGNIFYEYILKFSKCKNTKNLKKC